MRPPPRSSRLCLPSRALRFAPFGSRTPRLLRDLLPADADPPSTPVDRGQPAASHFIGRRHPIFTGDDSLPYPPRRGRRERPFWTCRRRSPPISDSPDDVLLICDILCIAMLHISPGHNLLEEDALPYGTNGPGAPPHCQPARIPPGHYISLSPPPSLAFARARSPPFAASTRPAGTRF